jgi:hypothetical protein
MIMENGETFEIGQVINWNDRRWVVVEITPSVKHEGRTVVTARLIQNDGKPSFKNIQFFSDKPKNVTYFSKGKKGWE